MSTAIPIAKPRPRILHIEDSGENRDLVREVLESKGFEVLEASDGQTGVTLALRALPDLILCDIQLPGLDGYETATKLRTHKELDHTPVVVLTAHGDRGLSLSIGCDGYIEKPIDVDRFPEQLREFLSGKRDRLRASEERKRLREYSQVLVERLEASVKDLSQANERLRALDRSKTEFMQNVSHELATPLTPITGYLKILRSGKLGPVTEQQEKVLEAMGQSAERLSRTIDNLVDFATLELGDYRVHKVPFDAAQMVRAVLDMLRPKARQKRVTLSIAERGPARCEGDQRKLGQAMANLVDNALKFSPHGGEVLVQVERRGRELFVGIYDQGNGIPESDQPQVFEPFFHADRGEEERAPGAGLGLPVARQIVEAHGGHVWIESPPKTQPEQRLKFGGTLAAFTIPAGEA